jgi:hypothetical protein
VPAVVVIAAEAAAISALRKLRAAARKITTANGNGMGWAYSWTHARLSPAERRAAAADMHGATAAADVHSTTAATDMHGATAAAEVHAAATGVHSPAHTAAAHAPAASATMFGSECRCCDC